MVPLTAPVAASTVGSPAAARSRAVSSALLRPARPSGGTQAAGTRHSDSESPQRTAVIGMAAVALRCQWRRGKGTLGGVSGGFGPEHRRLLRVATRASLAKIPVASQACEWSMLPGAPGQGRLGTVKSKPVGTLPRREPRQLPPCLTGIVVPALRVRPAVFARAGVFRASELAAAAGAVRLEQLVPCADDHGRLLRARPQLCRELVGVVLQHEIAVALLERRRRARRLGRTEELVPRRPVLNLAAAGSKEMQWRHAQMHAARGRCGAYRLIGGSAACSASARSPSSRSSGSDSAHVRATSGGASSGVPHASCVRWSSHAASA